MKTLRNILAILLLGFIPQFTYAQVVQVNTITTNWLSGAAGSRVGTNLFTYGVLVNSITIQNQSSSACTYGFFDSQNNKIEETGTVATYTIDTSVTPSTPASTTTTLFSIPAATRVQTNSISFGISSIKASGSVTTPRALMLNIPQAGSATVTYNFTPPLHFGRGIALTNTLGASVITFTYEPNLPN